jgi:hypothetical protein
LPSHTVAHQIHSRTINQASRLWIPSARLVLWSTGLPPSRVPATPNPSSFQPIQLVLWSSGLPLNRVPARLDTLWYHQPALFAWTLDCLRIRRAPRQCHFHTITPACLVELQTASENGARHAKSVRFAPVSKSCVGDWSANTAT